MGKKDLLLLAEELMCSASSGKALELTRKIPKAFVYF